MQREVADLHEELMDSEHHRFTQSMCLNAYEESQISLHQKIELLETAFDAALLERNEALTARDNAVAEVLSSKTETGA